MASFGDIVMARACGTGRTRQYPGAGFVQNRRETGVGKIEHETVRRHVTSCSPRRSDVSITCVTRSV